MTRMLYADKEFAVYKGDDLYFTGSLQEVAATLGIKPASVKWAASPAAQKRKEQQVKPQYTIICLDKEDTEDDNLVTVSTEGWSGNWYPQ